MEIMWSSPFGFIWKRLSTGTLSSRESRKVTAYRNMGFLLLVQFLMLLYVFCPYYISPYVFNTVDMSSVRNYTLELSNATFKQRTLPWLSARVLPRVLSTEEHAACVHLVKVVDQFFRKFNITYTLFYGSLVGSYVMHDMIPWDDDVDVAVKLSEKEHFKKAMDQGLAHYGLHAEFHDALRATTYKIFFKEGTPAGPRPWNWPFIDVAFYGENSTHIWNTNAEGVSPLVVPRHWFYPLKLRPFAFQWLPAPAKTLLILRYQYGHFKCRRFAWNHKEEKPWWSTAYAPCESLQNFYPFVWRSKGPSNNSIVETLRLGNSDLYSVSLYGSSFNGNSGPLVF